MKLIIFVLCLFYSSLGMTSPETEKTDRQLTLRVEEKKKPSELKRAIRYMVVGMGAHVAFSGLIFAYYKNNDPAGLTNKMIERIYMVNNPMMSLLDRVTDFYLQRKEIAIKQIKSKSKRLRKSNWLNSQRRFFRNANFFAATVPTGALLGLGTYGIVRLYEKWKTYQAETTKNPQDKVPVTLANPHQC